MIGYSTLTYHWIHEVLVIQILFLSILRKKESEIGFVSLRFELSPILSLVVGILVLSDAGVVGSAFLCVAS